MDVDHLDQRVTREGILALIIALLGGGEAVVAVANGKEKTVVLACYQRFKSVLHALYGSVAEESALDMSAVLHQVEVVGFFKAFLFLCEGLDNCALGVVDEQQYVRQLKRSVLAYLHARRYALENGRLGCSDGRGRAVAVVVVLEVDDADDAASDLGAGLALDVDHAVLMQIENVAVEVALHIRVDGGDALAVVVAEVYLGQDDAQRRRLVADDSLYVVPVVGLAGVLVARDYSPGLKILFR